MKIRSFLRKINKYIFNPRMFYIRHALKKLKKGAHFLDDEAYLKEYFRIVFGYNLDLSNPKTFNEKMQWLKLYSRDDKYTMMVDKHNAKVFVSSILGKEFVAKEYGVYNKSDEIQLDKLPDKFVLKTTHGCGGMYIVTDKRKFDLNLARSILDKSLKDNYYIHCREWPYKNVTPRIIAEEYLKDDSFDVLPVYKFFCFNGEPFILQAIKNDKKDNESIDYFDMTWKRLNIKQNFPNSRKPLSMPLSFESMKEHCRKLSNGIPFIRCDFYDVGGKAIFSEFTFFSDAGFEPFHPKKWDIILGDKIELKK